MERRKKKEVRRARIKEQREITEEFRGNLVSVGTEGVIIHSTSEKIDRLVYIADYLIKKHKRFMLGKKINKITTGVG